MYTLVNTGSKIISVGSKVLMSGDSIKVDAITPVFEALNEKGFISYFEDAQPANTSSSTEEAKADIKAEEASTEVKKTTRKRATENAPIEQ